MKQIRISQEELNEGIMRAINEVLDGSAPAGVPDEDFEDDEVNDTWSNAVDGYLMREKLPKGWEKHGDIYSDGDGTEYEKDEYGNFTPIDDEMEEDDIFEVRRAVRKMIRESFEGFDFGSLNSYGDFAEKKSYGSAKKSKHKKEEKSNPKTKKDKMATKRAIVINWLKNPSNAVNCAEIMRQLWHPAPEDEDTKRGEFYKKRDGAINKDSGARYSFDDDEINQLYKIKSNRGA